MYTFCIKPRWNTSGKSSYSTRIPADHVEYWVCLNLSWNSSETILANDILWNIPEKITVIKIMCSDTLKIDNGANENSRQLLPAEFSLEGEFQMFFFYRVPYRKRHWNSTGISSAFQWNKISGIPLIISRFQWYSTENTLNNNDK